MSDAVSVVGHSRAPRPFAARDRWDRNVFLSVVLLIWLGVIVGFGLDLIDRLHDPATIPYPIAVHVHAAVFITWLALLTTQVLLIRASRPDIHRRIGPWGMALGATMPAIGLYAEWMSLRSYHGTPRFDPAFASVPLFAMIVFAALIAGAYILRRDAASHKRLVLLATIYLSEAGFARVWFFTVGPSFGDGVWQFYVQENLAADLLIVGLGVYDLVTRGRLNKAFVIGAVSIALTQYVAGVLNFSPLWKDLVTRALGY